jgi:hypothetical protein
MKTIPVSAATTEVDIAATYSFLETPTDEMTRWEIARNAILNPKAHAMQSPKELHLISIRNAGIIKNVMITVFMKCSLAFPIPWRTGAYRLFRTRNGIIKQRT